MGIPSYFSFIVKNHASIIRKYNANILSVNNLYLDCNSIIYDAVNTISWKEEKGDNKTSIILRWVIKRIEEYILLIAPSNNIFIAFDGVAPVAKIEQQRGRRYKSWYQAKIRNDIFKDAAIDPWNTGAITPGTVFMESLTNTINEHFIGASLK
jgi:5'-3' exonuclease